MQIIPVIDLMGAQVVHAKKGHRHLYKPLRTRLCDNSEPLTVIKRLLRLYPFRDIYVADLDALMAKGNNKPLLERLLTTFPKVRFWIDQGLPNGCSTEVTQENHIVVIGSESLDSHNLSVLKRLGTDYLLSLDFNANGLLGPDQLLTEPHRWPEKIIVMSMDRVGSQDGPDYSLLSALLERCPDKSLIAAGGIRDKQDIRQLKERGITAVLLASALHTGVIDSSVLHRYA